MDACTPLAVVVSSLLPATGNAVTAARFSRLLEAAGYRVIALDVGKASTEVVEAVASEASLVIAVHAYRAGRLLRSICAPLVVVLGGTDVNQASAWEADPEIRAVLRSTFARAKAVVAFTPDMAVRYDGMCDRLGLRSVPQGAPHATVIPQGVAGSVTASLPIDPMCPRGMRSTLGIPSTDGVLLLIAGLRSVKAPLLLAPAVARRNAALRKQGDTLHLVLLGPLLDPAFASQVVAATGCDPSLLVTVNDECTSARSYGTAVDAPAFLGGASVHPTEVEEVLPSRFGGYGGVWYCPPVPHELLANWLRCESLLDVAATEHSGGTDKGRDGRRSRGITVVVNSSDSEGQCNALLEAMLAGVPVLARDNPGNSALIEHGVTGWLWHSPDECSLLKMAGFT